MIEQILGRSEDVQAYFWATHSGAELDLLLIRGQQRFGFEMKWGDAPGVTKSMRTALAELNLDSLALVYPGDRRAVLDSKIEMLPLSELDKYLTERGLIPRVPARSSRTRKRRSGR